MLDKAIWGELNVVTAATKKVVPEVVARYRDRGILTWALLHRMEEEVATLVEATGEYDAIMLNMICSTPGLCYPTDEQPVIFSNDSNSPIIFKQIRDAWKFTH